MIGIKSVAWSENKKDLIAYTVDGRRIRFVNAREESLPSDDEFKKEAAEKMNLDPDRVIKLCFDQVIDDRTGEVITK